MHLFTDVTFIVSYNPGAYRILQINIMLFLFFLLFYYIRYTFIFASLIAFTASCVFTNTSVYLSFYLGCHGGNNTVIWLWETTMLTCKTEIQWYKNKYYLNNDNMDCYTVRSSGNCITLSANLKKNFNMTHFGRHQHFGSLL